ncbi:MAG: hypothetical protein U5L96_04710 [Owenweeksia sp.]|nr:hypothetical protein [Owenweeksia sp.]
MKMKINGIDNIKIQEGQLVLTTPLGSVKEWIPNSYQIIDGQKHFVKCRYVITDGHIQFETASYDPKPSVGN